MKPEELVEILRSLEYKIDILTKDLVTGKKKEKLFGEWVDEKEVRVLTGLSRNTLLKLRDEGHITRSTISGKRNYYRLSDFKKLLDMNEGKS